MPRSPMAFGRGEVCFLTFPFIEPGVVADGSRLHFCPLRLRSVKCATWKYGQASAPAAKRYVRCRRTVSFTASKKRRHQGNHSPGDRFNNISAHYELVQIERALLFPDAPMRNHL